MSMLRALLTTLALGAALVLGPPDAAGWFASTPTVSQAPPPPSGSIVTTYTFVNNDPATLPAGFYVSFAQAFARGPTGVAPGNCVQVQNAATHAVLPYQLDQIASRNTNGDDGTIRHLRWSVRTDAAIASGATYTVEFARTGAPCPSPPQKQSLAALAAAHDLKLDMTDVRNQDGSVRGSGHFVFSINTAASNTGRDAPRKCGQGPVVDCWEVLGPPKDVSGGAADPLLYLHCFLNLTTATDGTSLGPVGLVCRADNPWMNIANPQAISYRPKLLDGANTLLDWAYLDATVTAASNPINTTTGEWNIPVSTGTHQWYYAQPVLLTTTGTPPGGLTNNFIYFVCPCDAGGTYHGDQTKISLRQAPNFAGFVTPANQGTGTHTLSWRVWHTHWQSWYTWDTDAKENMVAANGTRSVSNIYPKLTPTEIAYWETTGTVPPLTYPQTFTPETLNVGNWLSFNYNPLSRVATVGGSGGGGRPELAGGMSEWATEAWLRQVPDGWDKDRIFDSGAQHLQMAVILNEATGRIPAVNNGPPIGSHGEGTGTSYPVLGAPFPGTSSLAPHTLIGLTGALEGTPTAINTYGGGIWGNGTEFRNDHLPDYGKLQYIVFGRQWSLDALYIQGSRSILLQYPSNPGTAGNPTTLPGVATFYGLSAPYSEQRASGNAWREKVYPAALGADSNPERGYMVDLLKEQWAFYQAEGAIADAGGGFNYRRGAFSYGGNGFQDTPFMDNYQFQAAFMGWSMLHDPQSNDWLTNKMGPQYKMLWCDCIPNSQSSYYGGAYYYNTSLKDIKLYTPFSSGVAQYLATAGDGSEWGVEADQGYDFTAGSPTIVDHGSTTVFPGYGGTFTNGDKVKSDIADTPTELNNGTWYTMTNVDNTAHSFQLINPATGNPFPSYHVTGGGNFSGNHGYLRLRMQFTSTDVCSQCGYWYYAETMLAGLRILGIDIGNAWNTYIARIGGSYQNPHTSGQNNETWINWNPATVVP